MAQFELAESQHDLRCAMFGRKMDSLSEGGVGLTVCALIVFNGAEREPPFRPGRLQDKCLAIERGGLREAIGVARGIGPAGGSAGIARRRQLVLERDAMAGRPFAGKKKVPATTSPLLP